MPGVLARLKPFNLPCIVVDDGSDAATQQQLDNLVAEQPGVTLIRPAENAGKGAAVMRGLQAAADAGFSHAVQVDADGQHAIEDIPKLLALAEQQPAALISGQPIYDDSIPAHGCTGAGSPTCGMDRNALLQLKTVCAAFAFIRLRQRCNWQNTLPSASGWILTPK